MITAQELVKQIMSAQEKKSPALAAKQKRLLERLRRAEPDHLVALLEKAGLPLTRENYLGLAYPDGVPNDLDEFSLPPELRQ